VGAPTPPLRQGVQLFATPEATSVVVCDDVPLPTPTPRGLVFARTRVNIQTAMYGSAGSRRLVKGLLATNLGFGVRRLADRYESTGISAIGSAFRLIWIPVG
jgi:hypothetical protein